MRKLRLFILFVIVVFVVGGCATTGGYTASEYTSFGCTYADGYYICPKSAKSSLSRPGSCSWVKAYTKRDGVFVSGHYRCKKLTINTPKYSSSGKCHWVNGYYRKNGAYVRGHRRCR